MQRITRKELDGAIAYLNRITNNAAEPYRKEGDQWVTNVGNFHVSRAYGGFALYSKGKESGRTR